MLTRSRRGKTREMPREKTTRETLRLPKRMGWDLKRFSQPLVIATTYVTAFGRAKQKAKQFAPLPSLAMVWLQRRPSDRETSWSPRRSRQRWPSWPPSGTGCPMPSGQGSWPWCGPREGDGGLGDERSGTVPRFDRQSSSPLAGLNLFAGPSPHRPGKSPFPRLPRGLDSPPSPN